MGDAEATNKKKVSDWYEKCYEMGLVPEEFKLTVEENEPEEEDSQSDKKSFHKQRKEEWKKRNASKNVFKISEDKEEKENKKEHVFSKTRTRPPSLKFALSTMMAIYLLGFGAADPNGYRPSATKTDFREVQHNPELINQLRDLNHVTTNISTVHTDHVAVQTFVHELKVCN